jgi:two-component system alkaline phosphatase synthesis response regulator PhoP
VKRILVIEDNATLAEGLRLNLAHDGYEVRVEASGEKGLAQARHWQPQLIILDIMLPGIEGIEVLRLLRAEGREIPVLVLSARGSEADRLRGFRHADDYVVKPFSLAELLARVAAMLRRQSGPDDAHPARDRWEFGHVAVDRRTHDVRAAGAPVALRPKEFDLLVALLKREGRVATRAELLDEVWQYEHDVVSRTVDVHILELRRKLEHDPANPQHILTVRKTGYRLAR